MTTELTTLRSSDASADNIMSELDLSGAVIVSSLAFPEDVESILKELNPYIANTDRGRDEFSGESTTRTGAVVARSPKARDLIQREEIINVANRLLLPNCDKMQLMLTQVIRLLPGQGKQVIHRDRMCFGPSLKGIEPQLNTIWALTDFTEQNGATQVVPGSHKWDYDRNPTHAEIVQAIMPLGSVIIYTGSVLHSGGANKSNHARVGLNINYCLGWLRQEENQYLSCPPDVAKSLPHGLQELIGYTMPNYALGYYTDPSAESEGGSGVSAPELALGRNPRDPSKNEYLKAPAAC